MKTWKRIAPIVGAIMVGWSAEAQYTFNAELSISGNCFGSGSSMVERNLRQWINELNAMLKSIRLTKEECLAMNQQMSGEAETMSYSEYGCTIKLVVTPCVCTGAQSNASSGPDQGGSFNSANPGSEVRDWQADVEARQNAFDWRSQSYAPASGTGDKQFDDALQQGMNAFGNKVNMPKDFELLANMENVRQYLDMCNTCDSLAERYIKYPDPDHLVRWFHEEFRNVSGYNVDAIMLKLPSQQSDAEKQALLDYQAFRRLLADKMIEDLRSYIAVQEETRAYEMAVLSEDCYSDSEHKYLEETNYRAVSVYDFPMDDPRMKFLTTIAKCNSLCEGFHAQAYLNTVTGKLAVAFEGSNFHPIENWDDFKADWKECNFKQGFGGIPEQYVMAKIIAESIPEGVDVEFTGHSLGGGLASVAGAISGVPTYTYNAEGVSNNIIDDFGIRETVDAGTNNVRAYQANNDELTSVQEGDWKPVATALVIGLTIIANPVEAPKVVAETVKGNVLSPAIGDKQIVASNSGHKMEPMLDFLDGSRGHFTAWRNSIYNAGYGHEQQTQSSIQIRVE